MQCLLRVFANKKINVKTNIKSPIDIEFMGLFIFGLKINLDVDVKYLK